MRRLFPASLYPDTSVGQRHIVVNEGGLPTGAGFEGGLVLRETIPEAHKVAYDDSRRSRDHSMA
jgi:hypothetical protein